MRVPLSWLQEWVPWEDGPESLASLLTGRGVAVEAVQAPPALARGIIAGTVLAVEAHPRADRLKVCRVRAGERLGTVVCGAPDVEPGILVPWATPDSALPSGLQIATREVRGVASEGMLCAPDELGLPGGHGGLLRLDRETLPDGTPFEEGQDVVGALSLNDPVLVLELTPNYAAHCQSILGVAREVAAATGASVRWPASEPREDAQRTAASATRVRIDAPDLCPRYVARVCADVRHGASPLWMAHRLVQCAMRPVGTIVDVTNYVMLELGQPLHAFDLDRLSGSEVIVRRAHPGEDLVTLDGRLRALCADDLVIADGEGPVAIAGVMGGDRTEVTDDTRAVFLESAAFTADCVARTARRLALPSEASARFGRGVDPDIARKAADRAMLLLGRLAGARVLTGAVEAGAGVPHRALSLRGRYVRELLGIRLSTSACGKHLERLGFGVGADGADRLRVMVPGWRPDVTLEVDLVEEVARSYGFDRLPSALPPGDPGVPSPAPVRHLADHVRRIVLGAGYSEVVPFSFHGPEVWDQMRLEPDHPWRRATAVTNPMSGDQAHLRTTLAAGLLRALSVNARYRRADAAIFDIGRVFRPSRPEARPAEPLMLGIAGYGALRPADWAHPADPCDFFACKGLCEEILSRCGVDQAEVQWLPAGPDYPLLHPGRCAELHISGQVVGWLGELHPTVIRTFDLPEPAVVAEMDLGRLCEAAQRLPFRSPPRHPAARRDVAVIAAAAVPAAQLAGTVRAAAGDLLADIRLFDVYTGDGVPTGWRSLAFSLTYQADRTLTDAEVEERHARVRAALVALPNVRIR